MSFVYLVLFIFCTVLLLRSPDAASQLVETPWISRSTNALVAAQLNLWLAANEGPQMADWE